MTRWVLAGVLAVGLLGCGGGGRYGYARSYVYLGDEESHARRATSPVYDEVRRMPHNHHDELISWFGVVTDAAPGDGGMTRVAMEVRTHQERHLCEEAEESTCRVTVSEQGGGPFTALVRLSPEDQNGENRVQPGSLLRIYGVLVPEQYDAQGGPVLRAEYYRHWPRGQYVTTAARNSWRQ
jgi:hypothetical protein